jgi:hypothetical protein
MPTHDPTNPSRRRFLERAAGSAAVAAGLLSRASRAAELPHLAETDPAAQPLGYHADTRTVPAGKYPNHRPTQACGKCNFYKGVAGAQWGPCLLFPGKAVHVDGWCSAFTPKQ